jgi:dipeptidyl aminopeptidase/acylaminoacyl peptidase
MRSFIAILILVSLAISAAAQQWTVDDILLSERGSAMELSRDGTLAVWVKSKMDKKKGTSVSQLMLRNLTGDFEVQLTRGKDSSNSPHFSPDGTKIAFLTSRKDAEADESKDKPLSQVWILDVRGGEPYKLTSFKKGVKEVNWVDNDNLLVTAAEDPSLYEQQSKERKDTSNVVDDDEHAPPVRLFKFALKGKKPERLTENTDCITRTAVSDDGAWAVTIHERSLAFEYNNKIRPATFLHDLKAGTATQLFTDGKLLPRQVRFTTDNKGFYFATPFANHPLYLMAATTHLYYYDIASGQETRVNLDWDKDLGGGYDVSSEGLIALLADGVRYKPALYQKNGDSWNRSWVTGQHEKNIFDIEWSRDGKTLLYSYTTASVPGQWYAAKFAKSAVLDAKPITKLNSHIEKKTKAKTEIMTWTGAKDEEVEGVLYYPHNYEAGKKYPLVLMIHGGPHGTDMDSWSERWGYPHQLFAQRGAFILKPNYHGSGNYGLEWGESITGGQYNELEWIDCERGVDALIAKGLVDPEKLGTMGWSNGSIITIEITTRTTRYKAASAGAGDVNWISDWGNCQFGHSFDDLYLGTTPLADPEFYLKKSPLFRMDKVVTPTIIYFGTIDRQVPTEQGWQHYRALQHLGKTDTKFILFPGEAHGPRKYGHQHRKMTTELEWFDKYLFKTAEAKNEAMKPGSPLAAALKLKSAGDIPETVPRDEIAIGRFEVTRAQYAAFKSCYSYPAGTGAYPANNISFADATAYCKWLSNKTGKTYRLGTEKEMAKHLKPSAKDNTLDAWAGYGVNLDDAAKLAGSVAQLGPGTLLKPVGSFAGSGDDPIYDLGGNVAEWVVAEDGSGKALGGSADRPADAKGNGSASAAFTGFRVVQEF